MSPSATEYAAGEFCSRRRQDQRFYIVEPDNWTNALNDVPGATGNRVAGDAPLAIQAFRIKAIPYATDTSLGFLKYGM